MPIGNVEEEAQEVGMGVPRAILGGLQWWFWLLWPLTLEILHGNGSG